MLEVFMKRMHRRIFTEDSKEKRFAYLENKIARDTKLKGPDISGPFFT